MMKIRIEKVGFTLAEVLITLAIIGVVAAMTIPTLMNKTNDKELDTAKTQTAAKLVEAMNQMQAKEELTGYTTSEEFAEAFKKYMKITNVCDSTKLKDCFGYTTLSDDSGHSIDVSKMATVSKILPSGFDSSKYPSTTVGIQFVNGVTGVMTYKKDCEWQNPMEAGGGSKVGLGCLTLVYDINGAKKPNKLNKDIVLLNAKLPSLCTEFADGVCGTYYAAASVTPIDCTNPSSDGYEYCPTGVTAISEDYLAGAARLCGGQTKMASEDDLLAIVKKLCDYEKDCQGLDCRCGWEPSKATAIGLPSDGCYNTISGTLDGDGDVSTRNFCSESSSSYNEYYSRDVFRSGGYRNGGDGVICKE